MHAHEMRLRADGIPVAAGYVEQGSHTEPLLHQMADGQVADARHRKRVIGHGERVHSGCAQLRRGGHVLVDG
ncbi:hypothetical protein D3C73_1394880 [compost metagenome]